MEEIAHNIEPFSLPPKQTTSQKSSKQTLPIRIDDGIRKVDVVTHSQFKASQRKKALGVVGSQLPDDQLEELKQGDFVIVQLTPEHSPWYTHPFVIGEIHKDISWVDTTKADSKFSVQIYLPADVKSLLG